MRGAILKRRRQFRHGASGSAGIEFALIAPVFIGLIVSLFELGWTMTKIAMLDYAVAEGTKAIYTGGAQSGSVTQSSLEALICDRARVFDGCAQNISVELTPINAFGAPPATGATCVDDADTTTIAPIVQYTPGAGSEIMFMRVCVTTDVFTPGLGFGLALVKTPTGRSQIIATSAFMNEPF